MHLEVASGVSPASIDPGLSAQLLDILIDSALKHAPPKAPVTVRLSATADRVLIDVTDSGSGIASAEVADLFRPFHRGVEAQRRGVPSLGLGLSLARKIAGRLGAELIYERVEGGCRFRVAIG